jgi:hypothetical protein
MSILNLTQHKASKEQIESGVIDPISQELIQDLITFNELPTQEEMEKRADKLAEIAENHNCKKALIGGAPYFMSTLESIFEFRGIATYYAFSKRISEEKVMEDGSVLKTQIFKHSGFFVTPKKFT